MTYPINNYFINGLLNIFLLKSELFEKEITVNAYVKALMKGCRYFELSLEVINIILIRLTILYF